MNLDQLVYISEINKLGSFSAAAEKCHITVPGISQSVANLEEKLGVKIFTRSRQGITTTNEGKLIIEKAGEVLTKLEELKEVAKPSDTNLIGRINITSSPSLIMLLLKVASVFKRDHPEVKVEINENTAPKIINSVHKEIDDIGFIMINPDLFKKRNEWEYETLIKDKMYFCISNKSSLADKSTIKLDDFLNEQLVTYSGINTKLIIENIFKDKSLNLLFESNQFEVIKETIEEGFAFSLLSGLQIKNDYRVKNGSIIPVSIKEIENIEVPFGWIRKKGTYFSPETKEFLKYTKQYIATQTP